MSIVDKSVFKEFNKAVKVFLKDLKTNFPHIEYFGLISCSFAIVKRLSKKKPQQYFYEVIEEPHGKYILDRNADYFMSDQFTSSFWVSFTEFVKNQVRQLDNTNRQKLFDHLLVLIAWSKKCQQYRVQKKGGAFKVNNDMSASPDDTDSEGEGDADDDDDSTNS